MTVRLHCDHYAATHPGDEPPLVILHGLLGSAKNWRSMARKLAEHRAVYAVDLRNHGASPHAESMHYDDMAADVLALLDARGIDSAHLIGHSMGGKVAMKLAFGAGDRIRTLVVVDIPPAARTGDIQHIVSALQALPVTRTDRRAKLDELLSEHIAEPGLRAFLLQHLERAEGQFRWRVDLDSIARNLPQILGFEINHDTARYQKPTLFLLGANSDHVIAAHHPLIHNLFPLARIESIEGAGHWVHAEQPEQFAILVNEFLHATAQRRE